MVRLASRLCVKWLRGRFVFLARTLLLRLAGLPGRMAGRQRNRWGRFGFVWLGVAVVVPMLAARLGSQGLVRLRLTVAPVGPVDPTLRQARAWISSLRASCFPGIEMPCDGLPSSGRWSWFCGWTEGGCRRWARGTCIRPTTSAQNNSLFRVGTQFPCVRGGVRHRRSPRRRGRRSGHRAAGTEPLHRVLLAHVSLPQRRCSSKQR
jgi:hypothetical protein